MYTCVMCLLVLTASPNITVGFYKLLCDSTAQPRSVLFLVFNVWAWEVDTVCSSDSDVLQYLLIIVFPLCTFMSFFDPVLSGFWPPLSLGEQLHREAKLPLLLSVSAVTDSSHDRRLHLWPHIRPAPHGWIMEAALHSHVSLCTLPTCACIRVNVFHYVKLRLIILSSFP